MQSRPHDVCADEAAARFGMADARDEAASTRGARSEQRYRVLAEAMPQLVWAADAKGVVTYFNQRWYEYTGQSEAEMFGARSTSVLHPDDQARMLRSWEHAWRSGQSYEIEYRLRRHDGVYRWFISRGLPVYDSEGRVVEWVGTCTDIDEQKRAGEAQRFIAEASMLLAESLGYDETLARVARLAIRYIADWCAIDVLERDGQVRRVAVEHSDPAKVALAQELRQRYPYDPHASSGVAKVMRTGQPELIESISEDLISTVVKDPALHDILLGLGLRSSLVVPLIARDRTIGAITLVGAESGRQFDRRDLALAEDLAGRAATAIDNAQLYRELSQFKATLDRTLDSVFMTDPETLRILYANQGAIEHVGYSRAELLNMTTLDIKPALDHERFTALITPLLRGEQARVTFETVHRHKDGHDIPIEISLQYIAEPGEKGCYVSVARDISERKRSEAALRASERRYRVLTNAMPQLVWASDAHGRHYYYNQRWYEYTGLSEAESLGFGFTKALHPDDLDHTLQRWERAWRDGESYEIEYRLRRHDGVYHWFIGRAQPVYGPDEQIVEWVGTCTDIDEQKRHEQVLYNHTTELARIARLLEDRNRELDQFAYVTSHDLKAPLRGIANLSQWIEEDLGEGVPEDVRSHLGLLRGRVQRMEALIDGMLQYSRVGRTGGRAELVDSTQLLEELIDLLAPPPYVTITIAPNMPTLYAERLPLQQVFSNLISNAIKHHGGQDIKIDVSARMCDTSMYEFAVADNGPGIPPKYHDRIFGIFQTLASRDKVEGSGLGLALVRKIVEHQGGRVWLESSEGQGATFFFTWPNRAPSAENQEPA